MDQPVTRRTRTFLRRLLRTLGSLRAAALARLGTASRPCGPQDAEYEAAIDRVFKKVRRHERHLRSQEAQARKLLERFELEDEFEVTEELSSPAWMYAQYKALLERSWALRHEDPSRMVQLALLATHCAKRLDPQRYGSKHVFDFRCYAQAALGNALRVTQQLDEAGAHMVRAREFFEFGTRSAWLEIHLLDLEASLDADRRRFKEAIQGLRKVYRYHRFLGDKHLAGRALVMQGAYTTYAGDPKQALDLLRRSLELIDPSRDPTLAYAALHNQIWILCDCGRFREAERQLFELRRHQQHQGGHISHLKLRWMEGRIDGGLERLERAEETLKEVRDGMAAVNRGYDSALSSLDLAAVLMARGKTREAREVVSCAYRTFMALRIEREAIVSLIVLHKAFANGIATRAMVEEVAAYLRKLMSDPEAKFERKAWGREE